MKLFSHDTNQSEIKRGTSFHAFLSIYTITLMFIFFFWISYSDKATNNNHIGQIMTFLITIGSLIFGFWFGSSMSDKKKNEVMENLIAPKDGSTTITTRSPDPEVMKANEEVKQNEITNQKQNP